MRQPTSPMAWVRYPLLAAVAASIATATIAAAQEADSKPKEVIRSGASASDPENAPRFTRHIIPLFSRMGCNAGTCHGAVQGQKGFRLSLFGVAPAADHVGITRELGGRRLDFQDLSRSLLLEKATGRVHHGGGARIKADSREYRMLLAWLNRGAELDAVADSAVTQLEVTPRQHVGKVGEKYSLRITARFADGSNEDVTSLCTYESLEKDLVAVDAGGSVQILAPGDTAIVVRYAAEPVVSHVLAPFPNGKPLPQVAPANVVDEHVLAKLKRLNLPQSATCDDATFLRRVSLDLTGTLPTSEEARAFLSNKSPDKRTKKIDELLSRPTYATWWATKFCDVLKPADFDGNFAMKEAAEARRFHGWLAARLAENVPYDQLAERILTATSREGRSQEEWIDEALALAEENSLQSPNLTVYAKRKTLDLYWQRKESTGVKGALQVAHGFLGLRLECAQCHRHPNDVWKQDDLLSFANFFMKVKGANYPDSKTLPPRAAELMKKAPEDAKKVSEEAKKLAEKAKDKNLSPEEQKKLAADAKAMQQKATSMTDGPKRFGTDVAHLPERQANASMTSPLGTQKSDKFRLLGERESIQVAKPDDPRVLVMAWLRRPDNPYFAKAIVNRLWAHYLGRGIVDPPDNLSALNPPTHPELLDALARGFINAKYDLKWLHRAILTSKTYQASCEPLPESQLDRRNYAYFYLRRISAEALLDAVNHATLGKEQFPAKLYLPADARAIEVAGVTKSEDETASLGYMFQVFGRPSRNPQLQCDCERENRATIVQTLYLANHPRVREKIVRPEGRLAKLLADVPDDARRIEELYLNTLSRLPKSDEMETCKSYVKAAPSPQQGYEDVLWSLLNTREFLLNH